MQILNRWLVVRVKFNGFFKGSDRLCLPAQGRQERTAIIPDIRICRIQGDRPIRSHQGLLLAIEPLERDRLIIPSCCIVIIETRGFLESSEGGCIVLHGH